MNGGQQEAQSCMLHEGMPGKIMVEKQPFPITIKIWFVTQFLNSAIFQRAFMELADNVSGVIWIMGRSKSPVCPVNFNRSSVWESQYFPKYADQVSGKKLTSHARWLGRCLPAMGHKESEGRITHVKAD